MKSILISSCGQGESAFPLRQLAIDDEIFQRMATLEICNRRHNYHGPHGAHDGQPPATATQSHVNNVLDSYS